MFYYIGDIFCINSLLDSLSCYCFDDLLHSFSGEKTSTKEWPSSLEIKGRVRLDAFEKFLQELPMSRSRAVMVYQVSFYVLSHCFESCVLMWFISMLFIEIQGAIPSLVAIDLCLRLMWTNRVMIVKQHTYGANDRFSTIVFDIIIRIPKLTFFPIYIQSFPSEYLIVSLLGSVCCVLNHCTKVYLVR